MVYWQSVVCAEQHTRDSSGVGLNARQQESHIICSRELNFVIKDKEDIAICSATIRSRSLQKGRYIACRNLSTAAVAVGMSQWRTCRLADRNAAPGLKLRCMLKCGRNEMGGVCERRGEYRIGLGGTLR